MIAICIPSRGLIFSKTVESVILGMQYLNQHGIATIYCASHENPIPDSHCLVTEKALANPNVKKIIFIEEDMYLFPEAFLALASTDAEVATLQYNDKNGSPFGILHYNEAQELLWGGLGATAVKREVFEKIGAPYFRTDHMYKNIRKHIDNGKAVVEYEEIEPRQVYNNETDKFEEKRDHYKYGGLDIDFYTRVRRAGYKPQVIQEYKAHHFKLIQLGGEQTNNGIHEIRQV